MKKPINLSRIIIPAALALLLLLSACGKKVPKSIPSSESPSERSAEGPSDTRDPVSTNLVLASFNIKNGSEGLEKIKEAANTGKPLILLTHVPIQPLGDDSLSDMSKEVYQDRALIWGRNPNLTHYFPTEDTPNGIATGELLDMIYAEDSPFTEVLCGHMHFTWDGQLTEKVHQHVFSAAFDRHMGIITISGE